MNKAQLNHFRKKLTDLLTRLGDEDSELRQEMRHAQGDSAVDQQSSSEDLGRQATNDDVAISLLGTEEELTRECSAALERIDNGTYGQCENCNKEMSKERLEALPYARTCIRCARGG